MNSNGSSPIDPFLAAKLLSLKSLDGRIADLVSQIKRMQAERRNLEQEIAVMRASTVPIHRLPTEIILYIFKERFRGVKDDFERRRSHPSLKIVHLMLVCKPWYHIIVNSPILWTEIYFNLHNYDINTANLSRHLQYVQTFMNHSKELPINISIDLRNLGSGQTYLEGRLEIIFSSLAGGIEEEDGDELRDATFDWYAELQECPIGTLYERLCGRFLRSVVGENGGYMKRWNSLHLALPYNEEFANEMLKFLDFEAPLLRSLHFNNGRSLDDAWASHSLRTSATLDRIHLDGGFTLSSIPESYGARHLEILNIDSFHALDFLNHFHNLRYLRLHSARITPDLTGQPIRLPHLQHLRVGGWVPEALFSSFEITRLSHLSLNFLRDEQPADVPFPTANLFQVVDFLSISIQFHVWIEKSYQVSETVSTLAGLFNQLSSTTIIGAEDSLMVAVSSTIDECKARGELPALRSLVKVNEDGEIIGGTQYATYLDSSSES